MCFSADFSFFIIHSNRGEEQKTYRFGSDTVTTSVKCMHTYLKIHTKSESSEYRLNINIELLETDLTDLLPNTRNITEKICRNFHVEM